MCFSQADTCADEEQLQPAIAHILMFKIQVRIVIKRHFSPQKALEEFHISKYERVSHLSLSG